jgi:hypothetical protein
MTRTGRTNLPRHRHLFKFLALVPMLAALAACGGGHGGNDTPRLPDPPSGLSYASPQTFVVSRQIAPLVPTLTGSVSSWSVSPSLPTGLSLDATSGQITGTPMTPTSSGAYTIVATNQGGSTSAILTITVNDTAPAITYPSSASVFTTEVPITPIAPNNAGGAVVDWSIDPTLPPGLTLDSSDGSITGTPSAAHAAATYTVTATNSGGTTTATVQFSVESGVFLDLGHAAAIHQIRYETSRIFSLDDGYHWVLWNAQTGASIARGEARTCPDSPCTVFGELAGDFAGPVFVVWTTTGLDVRSSSDGRVSAHIAADPAAALRWALATDGSYIVTGDSSHLAGWSPSGAMLWSRTGDYSRALLYAAPSETHIAQGPAGNHVIETIDVTDGSVSTTPSFQGDFNFWFGDGSNFVTTLMGTNWFYSNDGVLHDVWASTYTHQLRGGVGQWFWADDTNAERLEVYTVGASGAPTASYLGITPVEESHGMLMATGDQFALSVIDLSGATPARFDYPSALRWPGRFAALSPSDWIVGEYNGLLTNAATPAQYYGYGKVFAIAGSSRRFAVATARGGLEYFDAATKTEEGHIDIGSPLYTANVLLSDDGSVLAVATDLGTGNLDHSLDIYSLPDGSLVKSWLYPNSGDLQLFDISLSGSGLVVGQSGRILTERWREIDTTGGVTLYSNLNDASDLVPRLSPDGSLAGLLEIDNDYYTTGQILKNGVLSTAVAGYPIGWIDDNRLLITAYPKLSVPRSDPACAIANSVGTTIQTCSLPPQLPYIQRVGSDTTYSPNAIYEVSTGQVTWSSPNPIQGPGAVAGPYVVFVSNGAIRAERYQ